MRLLNNNACGFPDVVVLVLYVNEQFEGCNTFYQCLMLPQVLGKALDGLHLFHKYVFIL